MTLPDRRLRWEARLNVRELGGLGTARGPIRSGVLVRASAMGPLTAAGAAAVQAYGVRTVIDLRGPDELKSAPTPFGAGLTYRNAQVDREHTLRLHEHALAGTMPRQLLDLSRPGSGVRAALAAIACAEAPIVVSCQAGRDRTGIVVALLLAAFGVADEDIVSDHCLSDDELAADYARFGAEHPEAVADIEEHRRRRPWVIAELLAAIRSAYGHAADYLGVLGVAPAEIDRLQALLLA